ncbi:MAG: AzlD domain-containing protein [Treponema sp.]|nr:AzlD domain-containing protein [Treponema sp.]
MASALPVRTALLATVLSAAIIFATRALPFLLFAIRKPPRIIAFIEKYIPPMIMAVLFVYCFKDVRFAAAPFGAPHIIALTAIVAVHRWRHNPLLSIGGGTLLFVLLQRML